MLMRHGPTREPKQRTRSPAALAYGNGVRGLWEHRQVLRMMVLRELQRKYSGFRLGYVWTLLEPLGMTFVLWLVFSLVLGKNRLGTDPYFLFIAVAILPWWWFTHGVAASAKVFSRGAPWLRTSILPSNIWVMRAVLVSMAEFILSLPVVLIAMLVTLKVPSPLIILYPVAILFQLWFMYGLGLLVSAASAVIRDLERIIRIGLRTMFYLSPVLYSIANIPSHIRPFAALNPLVAIFGLYRVGFWPAETESIWLFLLAFSVCVVIVLAGTLTFRRLEPRILKEA